MGKRDEGIEGMLAKSSDDIILGMNLHPNYLT
jgi:hypothetical protein